MSPEIEVRTASTLSRAIRQIRQEFDLNITEAATLLAIAENEGCTPTDLARICGYTVATASRTARALLSDGDEGAMAPFHGLALMRSGPRNAKLRHLFLSATGRRLCLRLDALVMSPASPILSPSGALFDMAG